MRLQLAGLSVLLVLGTSCGDGGEVPPDRPEAPVVACPSPGAGGAPNPDPACRDLVEQ